MREKLRWLRCYGPMILAAVCLGVAYSAPPVVAYVLVIAAFVLAFDGGLSLYEKAVRAGGMKDFRQ
jgi:hypothetical protein